MDFTKESLEAVRAEIIGGRPLWEIALSMGMTTRGLVLVGRQHGVRLPTAVKRDGAFGPGHNRPKIQVPEEPIRAYTAGLFDGEGNISIQPRASAARVRPNVAFRIVNTDREVLTWLQSTWHVGSVYLRQESRLRQRPAFVWHVGAQADVFVLLSSLQPYLRIKHEEAKRAMESMWSVNLHSALVSP